MPRIVSVRGLTELMILDPSDASNRFVYVDGASNKTQGRLDQFINWSGDSVDPPWEIGPLTVNINTAGPGGSPAACANGDTDSTLTGHDD